MVDFVLPVVAPGGDGDGGWGRGGDVVGWGDMRVVDGGVGVGVDVDVGFSGLGFPVSRARMGRFDDEGGKRRKGRGGGWAGGIYMREREEATCD